MRILLTNDDGIYAEGLWALHKVFAAEHDVTVIAPDRERSAVAYAITLHEPLRLNRIQVNGGGEGYAVSGTPVDCVKLGLIEVLPTRPDMVISGINPGANVGVNVNYSGTVAAAREAALYGIPALAVSVEGRRIDDFEEIASFIYRLAGIVFEKGLPVGTILNVNVPDVPLREIAGIKVSRQGIALLSERFEKRLDPRSRAYYWQGAEQQAVYRELDVDGGALKGKYVSITPLKCDMTDYLFIDDLKKWKIDL